MVGDLDAITAAHDDVTTTPGRPTVANFCPHPWTWDVDNRSPEALVVNPADKRTVVFHPSWSNGTAGIRGTKPLDTGLVYYWEVRVSRRLFGTSLMFGVATSSARLHVDAFVNLLGEDQHSWALSHKGTLWHRARFRQYTKPFSENDSTTVGLLFDGPRATLTYYKDGVCLGTAFTDIDTSQTLYPAVCSTAAKTEMSLVASVRSFVNLQDRCRAVIARHLTTATSISVLPLPLPLKHYVNDVVDVGCGAVTSLRGGMHAAETEHHHPEGRRRRVNVALKFWPPSDANYWPRAAWMCHCVRR